MSQTQNLPKPIREILSQAAQPPAKLEGGSNIEKLFSLTAQKLGVKEVAEINPQDSSAQFCLTCTTVSNEEWMYDRLYFQMESNSPYFKTLTSAMMAHEKADVTSPDVRHDPDADVQFEFRANKLEKQWGRRIHRIYDALNEPDEQLQSSLDSMAGLMQKVQYSPQSEQDEVANFEISGKKFHMALEPSQNMRDGALVMGMNLYASPLLQEVIRAELLESRAAFKDRPIGIVLNGPKALRVVNELLSDPENFSARLERLEEQISVRNNLER